MLLPVLKNFSIAKGIGFDYRFQWDQGAPGSSLPYDLSQFTASCALTDYSGNTTYRTLTNGTDPTVSSIIFGGSIGDPTNGIIDIVLTGSDISALPVTTARYKLLMTPTGIQPIWLMYGVFTVIA